MSKEKVNVIKIGGNVIDDPHALKSFLSTFSTIKGKKILVHGGGKIATQLGEKMGVESHYVEGRRITDADTIDLVTMVYGGLINKKITAILQSFSCNAIGLSGADANILPAKKRVVQSIDYGWVGDLNIENIPIENWILFLENNLTPVIAPLTHDNQGNMLNTNADTIAASIAMALSSKYEIQLIYCFEKNGVLENVNEPQSVISQMTESLYGEMKKNNRLFAGIFPKIDNAIQAAHNGVKNVFIGHSDQLASLISGSSGTRIII